MVSNYVVILSPYSGFHGHILKENLKNIENDHFFNPLVSTERSGMLKQTCYFQLQIFFKYAKRFSGNQALKS